MERADGLRMHDRQAVGRVRDRCIVWREVGRAVDQVAQIGAQGGWVGQRDRGAEFADCVAVGHQPGRVYAIQRCAAHQADDGLHAATRLCVPRWCTRSCGRISAIGMSAAVASMSYKGAKSVFTVVSSSDCSESITK